MESNAVIDETGEYRYRLHRGWDSSLGRVLFVMLNPSTADAVEDDRTIRRCIDFAKSWGFGSLAVVNLFAYRTTDPSDLEGIKRERAIGQENLSHVCDELDQADLIVAAWGDNAQIHDRHLDEEVVLMCGTYTMKCFGFTKKGHPLHPLYQRADADLIDYVHRFPKSGHTVRMYEDSID